MKYSIVLSIIIILSLLNHALAFGEGGGSNAQECFDHAHMPIRQFFKDEKAESILVIGNEGNLYSESLSNEGIKTSCSFQLRKRGPPENQSSKCSVIDFRGKDIDVPENEWTLVTTDNLTKRFIKNLTRNASRGIVLFSSHTRSITNIESEENKLIKHFSDNGFLFDIDHSTLRGKCEDNDKCCIVRTVFRKL